MSLTRTYTHEDELSYSLVEEIPPAKVVLGAGRPPVWPERFAFARSNPGQPVRIGPLSASYSVWQASKPLRREPDADRFTIDKRYDTLPGEPESVGPAADPVKVSYLYVTYTPEPALA